MQSYQLGTFVKIVEKNKGCSVKTMIRVVLDSLKNPLIRNRLLSTPPDTLLLYNDDSIWGNETNYFGKILTAIVFILRQKSCDKMNTELKDAIRIGNLKTVFQYGEKASLVQGNFELSPTERKSIETLEMHPHKIFVYGKYHNTPREVGFYSDDNIKGYGYSRSIVETQKLTPELKKILERVNAITDSDFNAILVNRYRCGDDYIAAHSDDEGALGKVGVVSISLGQQRTFRLRDKKTKEVVKNIQVKDGDLYWMKGDNFQRKLTHEIPKEKSCKGVRMSLTFRKHMY